MSVIRNRFGDFFIRNANLCDFEAYVDLLQISYEFTYTDEKIGLTKKCFSKEVFSTKNTQSFLKTRLIDSQTIKTWLAFLDKKLIGSVTCTIKNENEAELSGFYVLSEYQNCGIGKRLYGLALEFAGNRNFLLNVYAHNKKTIEIYKKWGWKLDKTKGKQGYFTRHWDEWPAGLEAKSIYMILKR